MDNLSKYGKNFQNKLIYLLFNNKKFFARINEVLDSEQFSSESRSWVVDKIKEYYKEYSELPDANTIKVLAEKQINNNANKKVNVKRLLKKIKNGDGKLNNNSDFVKEESIEFFKHKNLESVILQSADLLKDNKFDTIEENVREAINITIDKDLGLNYIEDIEDRYIKQRHGLVPTGWSVIDNIIDGGVGNSELAVVLGPSGSGKCVGPNTKLDLELEKYTVKTDEGIKKFTILDKIKYKGEIYTGYEFLKKFNLL